MECERTTRELSWDLSGVRLTFTAQWFVRSPWPGKPAAQSLPKNRQICAQMMAQLTPLLAIHTRRGITSWQVGRSGNAR